MKILYIVSTLERCGPVNVLYNIIKNLDRNIFTPIILTLSPEKSNSRMSDFCELGVEVYCLNKKGILSLLLSGNSIKKTIMRLRPDVIHTHGIRADLLAGIFLKKYYTISTIHNYPYEDYTMAYGKYLGNIMAFLHLMIFRKIIHPIACSNAVSEKIRKKTGKKYNVIKNGIDTSHFTFTNYEEKIEAKLKLGIPKDKKVFLFLGALIQRKNPLLVIDAFKKSKLGTKGILLIVGDGELYQKCYEHIGSDPNILLIGRVDNPILYYKAADFYVANSYSEGLPMAVLEAMATGLPCILSDIESHNEILALNSKAGMLFRTNDLNDLISKINLISEMNYNILSRSAYDLITQNLSDKIMSKRYQKLYLKKLDY